MFFGFPIHCLGFKSAGYDFKIKVISAFHPSEID